MSSSSRQATSLVVEACVTSLAQAQHATRAGAHRLELCSALEVGGLTPSIDCLHTIRSQSEIPVFVMVRPRPGSFVSTAAEIDQMALAVQRFREAGVDGIVCGVLLDSGDIDVGAVRALTAAADGLPLTFHRAFDQVRDPLRALEELVSAGVRRILTSGGAGTAWAGRHALRQLVQTATDRVEVIAAGTVRQDHVANLVKASGVSEVHARASAIPGVVAALGELGVSR